MKPSIRDMIETIRVLVKNRLDEFEESDQEVRIEASCFWHAVVGMKYLQDRVKDGTLPKGTLVLIQAGSMSWPIVKPEDDDGVSPTHFSYVYERDNPDNAINLLLYGALPEMHVWNALLIPKKPPVIVDLCTRYHKDQMEWMNRNCEGFRMKWTAADPPDHLWAMGRDVPAGVIYKPDESAIRTVLQFAMNVKLMTRDEVISYLKGE